MSKSILVTGGAGFIGSHFVRNCLKQEMFAQVVNLDALTLPIGKQNMQDFLSQPGHHFVKTNLANSQLLPSLLKEYQIDAVVHFAAETHVDRSLLEPETFIESNVQGTFCLLEAVRAYWQTLDELAQQNFRFLHVSTDEVYGALGDNGAFTEQSPYAPNSPYSASKAASDHLVRAWHQSYQLPTLITHCSNNFGPYQHSEKLIPKIVSQALAGQPLTVYGEGQQVRDWLYVLDHVQALQTILAKGKPGEVYNIGGGVELTNIDLVQKICLVLDSVKPKTQGCYSEQISFVADRPGHDWRYALDCSKLADSLSWRPHYSFEQALTDTVRWYAH